MVIKSIKFKPTCQYNDKIIFVVLELVMYFHIHFSFIHHNNTVRLITHELELYICRRRQWHPTPVLLPGESQGRGSLFGCRLWGCTESDTTEAT